MAKKTNERIEFQKDRQKTYIYINEKFSDRTKDIGILMWDFKKKKWIFNDLQK